MKRKLILGLVAVLIVIFVIPVEAQTIERTLSHSLLPLQYKLNDDAFRSFGVGQVPVDDIDRFEIIIIVDLSDPDGYHDSYDVSNGPWITRFQVWVDGALKRDDDNIPRFSETLTQSEYGQKVVIKVRAEGEYRSSDGEFHYIYSENERTFTFDPIITNPIYLLLFNPLIWFIGLVCVIGFVVKRRSGKKGKEVVEVVAEPTISKDAKVFVICRFCGAKTEQGIMKCQKCGADL